MNRWAIINSPSGTKNRAHLRAVCPTVPPFLKWPHDPAKGRHGDWLFLYIGWEHTQRQQAVDFVTYYDAANSHRLVVFAIAISTGLVVLAIVACPWHAIGMDSTLQAQR